MNRHVGIMLAVGVAIGIGALTAGATVGSDIVDGPDSVTTPTPTETDDTVDGTTIATTNGRLTLNASSEQVIRGRTDLPAGTTVTVRLQSTSSEMAFIRSTEAAVTDNGTFRTTVDLSQVTDQPTFQVRVHHDGNEIANASGRVVGTPEDPVGTTDPENSTEWERVNRTDSDSAPANATFLVDGDQLTLPATSDAQLRGETWLSPGTNVSVRIRSTSSETPFIRNQETTVGENGTVAVAYNMSAVAPGSAFEASIRYDGEELVSRSGTVAE